MTGCGKGLEKTSTKKRNAFFIEIIIVILFFSISVVVALEMFVQAHAKSVLSEQKNMALIRAQSAAELLEGFDPAGGDYAGALEGSVPLAAGSGCVVYYDGGWALSQERDAAYELTALFGGEETGAGRMVTVQVSVRRLENGKDAGGLVSFETGYYLRQD